LLSNERNNHSSNLATIGGIGALLLWSTTVAVVRSLSEQVGTLTAAAGVFTVSAFSALIPVFISRQNRQNVLRLPKQYLIVCGALFIGYMILLFLAIGKAQNRQQVLEVALLNYLWPMLTLLFSLPLLGKKAGWMLVPGTVLALAGLYIVTTMGGSISWPSFTNNIGGNPSAYLFALAAALFWALYSNLARKLAGDAQEGGVAIFLFVSAMVLIVISLFAEKSRPWSGKALLEMLFLGIATFVAYSLWDKAMRKGHIVFVAACSYLTPLFSTLVSSFYLAVIPGARLWLGCSLLIVGSVLSWRSISDRERGAL
jgi:drug/metabolite transporter (DMT)-like permease